MPTTSLVSTERKWVRSPNGMLAGVCQGVAERFGVDAWTVRALWLIAVFAFGTGLLLYVVMAFCLPRADRAYEADRKKLLGVCLRLSKMSGIDVSIVRVLAVFSAFFSLGVTAIVYLVLHMVLPNINIEDSSEVDISEMRRFP